MRQNPFSTQNLKKVLGKQENFFIHPLKLIKVILSRHFGFIKFCDDPIYKILHPFLQLKLCFSFNQFTYSTKQTHNLDFLPIPYTKTNSPVLLFFKFLSPSNLKICNVTENLLLFLKFLIISYFLTNFEVNLGFIKNHFLITII